MQYERLTALEALYAEWNARINVISRKDMDHFYERHVLHALGVARVHCFDRGSQVLDIGTGGGFPGIPLAILFPSVQFDLVDSIGKKIKVVQAVTEALGLENVRAIHGRAEDQRSLTYDAAVTRAVAPLKKLWGWARPLLKKANGREAPGLLIALKGGDLSAEIAESNCQPQVYPLRQYFEAPFFSEKYVLVVERRT